MHVEIGGRGAPSRPRIRAASSADNPADTAIACFSFSFSPPSPPVAVCCCGSSTAGGAGAPGETDCPRIPPRSSCGQNGHGGVPEVVQPEVVAASTIFE